MLCIRAMGALLAGTLMSAAFADTVLYVDDDAPAGGNGTSWETAFRFLQDALMAARTANGAVNEIRVAQGTYKPDHDEQNPDGTQDEEASFGLIDGIALRGGYAGVGARDPDARDVSLYASILSGQIFSQCATLTFAGSDHIITSDGNDSTAIIDGFVITCGLNTFPGGGGMLAVKSNAVVLDCTFENNGTEVGDGGAVFVEHGGPLFANCSFYANFVDPTGAAQCSCIHSIAATTTMVNCDFIGNLCDGAVQNVEGSSTTIIGCTFECNVFVCAGGGPAGIRNVSSTAVISECEFRDNDDESAGAISNTGSIVAIDSCVFDNNNGDGSGAIFNGTSTVSILKCIFVSNSGGDGINAGGAVHNSNSQVDIVDCAFLGNSGGTQNGGAIYNVNTDAFVVNCVFSENGAGSGGAVANVDSDPVFVNCTFSANDDALSPYNSSAIYVDSTSAPSLINCIVWNHDEPTFGGAGKIAFSYCNIEDVVPPGIGNISTDPLFVDFDGPDNTPGTIDDNLRLLPGSPCIDAGDNTAVPADEFDLDGDGDTAEPIPFDLAGLPRFLDDPKTIDTGNGTPPIVDMGAYEFTGSVNPLDLTGDGVVDAADLAQLLAQWGPCAPSPPAPLPGGERCPADYTADGIVNAADLGELLANWG
jgi:hypothetical protein